MKFANSPNLGGTRLLNAAGLTDASGNLISAGSYAGKALLVFDGNSLWQGTGSSHLASSTTDTAAGPFPSQTLAALQALFPSAQFTFRNFGVAGQTTIQMLADVATETDTLYNASLYDRHVYFPGEGTNHLANGSGATAQQAVDAYVKICRERRAAGYSVVASTMLARTAGFTGITAADFETARQFYNNYLKANYLKFADFLCDIASLTGLVFGDGIHTNDAGYLQIGNLFATVAAPLLVKGFNVQSMPFILASLSGTTTTTSGNATTSDTAVLLQLNGAGSNNSTSIVDNSTYNRTITRGGGVQISTTQSKFGGSSLFFNGSDAYVTVPASTDFDFGSGDWTAEFWLYPTGLNSGFPGLLTRGDWDKVLWTIAQNNSNAGRPELFIQQNNNYTQQNLNSSAALALNAWTHIAVVSSGGTRKIWTNGALSGTASGTLSMEANGTGKGLNLGVLPAVGMGVGAGDYFQGYLHFRLTKTARYTAAFTPPASF